jgi:mono/diheme cytochrome c family protein
MYAHFTQVGGIQDAVVRGDLDATRGPARWLATHNDDQFGSAGDDAQAMMRNEARIIMEQKDILDIGRSVARMGAACGSCHTATGGGPSITVGEPPASSTNPGPHMVRHAWGADRLWEGLFAPSDAAWAAGAGALASMPLDFGANDQASRLAQRVHDLSQKAQTMKDLKDRTQIYGDFMETCSLCHGSLGMRIN